MEFLETESSTSSFNSERYCMQTSPSLLLRISRTLSDLRLRICLRDSAEKQLESSRNLLIFMRLVVIANTPSSPILFSPKSNDFNPLKGRSRRMSWSMMPWLGRSTYYVYSVIVVWCIVTSETGLTALAVGAEWLDSKLIYNLSDISLMAAYNFVFASDSSFELSNKEVSTCACLARQCLISSFSLR